MPPRPTGPARRAHRPRPRGPLERVDPPVASMATHAVGDAHEMVSRPGPGVTACRPPKTSWPAGTGGRRRSRLRRGGRRRGGGRGAGGGDEADQEEERGDGRRTRPGGAGGASRGVPARSRNVAGCRWHGASASPGSFCGRWAPADASRSPPRPQPCSLTSPAPGAHGRRLGPVGGSVPVRGPQRWVRTGRDGSPGQRPAPRPMSRSRSGSAVVERLLGQFGTTWSAEAGFTVRNTPAPLFRLLVLSLLLSARTSTVRPP